MTGKISPVGDQFARLTPDGRFEFWDVLTGKIASNFVPPEHLSSKARCLDWVVPAVVAFGTSAGEVLFLNIPRNLLVGHPLTGQSSSILSLLCCQSQPASKEKLLFAGSESGHVVRWKLDPEKFTGTIEKKWKADKGGITAMVLVNDHCLITGSSNSTLTLWNLSSGSAMTKLTGHVHAITSILRPEVDGLPKKKRKSLNKQPIIVSASESTRSVCVWRVKEGEEMQPITLSSSADVAQISACLDVEGSLIVAVVTKTGVLQIFTWKFSEPNRFKPVAPLKTVKFVVAGKQKQKEAIPILHAAFLPGAKIWTVREDWALPSFEILKYEDLSDDVALERKRICTFRNSSLNLPATTVREPVPGSHVDYSTGAKTGQKRARNSRDPSEQSLAERLRDSAHDAPAAPILPDSGRSLTQLLMEGLQSKDRLILERVLRVDNPAVVMATVKRLPVEYVPSLLSSLTNMLTGKVDPDSGVAHVRWVKNVLTEHTSFLASNPESESLIRPLMLMREEGEGLLRRMSELKGRFELLHSKIDVEEPADAVDMTPVHLYRDDSDDDLGLDVPASAEENDLWDSVSEHSDAEEGEEDGSEASDEDVMEVEDSGDDGSGDG